MKRFSAGTLWGSADLGTNTFRLLIAEEVAPGRLVQRELHQGVARLGEGLGERGGRLLPAAIGRAEALLGSFRARLDALTVERRFGGLTAAGRDAADGSAFRDLASRALRGEVRILEGAEEATLSAQGALSLVDAGERDVLFLDIGGGSTEIVALRCGKTELALSLPSGVVKISEAESLSDPPLPGEVTRLEETARRVFDPVSGVLDEGAWRGALGRDRAVVVATAGTPLTVAARVRGLTINDTRALSGTQVSRRDLETVWSDFLGLQACERLALESVEPGREDVILAGLALLRAFVERFAAPVFTVSDGGLLEGLLLDAVARERGSASWASRPGVAGDRSGG